tara:strand:+ start:796 stop:1335 length:540 start_codon:yes stop_codon:yes gene_type:complete
MNKKVLIFSVTPKSKLKLGSVSPHYKLEQWKPNIANIIPPNQNLGKFLLFWLFNYLKIFKNTGYSIYLLKQKDELITRIVIFPAFFRFPFMNKRDIQVGYIFSDINFRGQGLAKWTLKNIINDNLSKKIWYVTEEENQASIKLAKSCGFNLYGYGERTVPLGISLFGRFIIKKIETDTN